MKAVTSRLLTSAVVLSLTFGSLPAVALQGDSPPESEVTRPAPLPSGAFNRLRTNQVAAIGSRGGSTCPHGRRIPKRTQIPSLISSSLPAQAIGSSITDDPEMPRCEPIMFVENVGQFAEAARFRVYGLPDSIWLAKDALWLTKIEKPGIEPAKPGSQDDVSYACACQEPPVAAPGAGVNLKLTFPGANPRPQVEPFQRLETTVSYLTGDDRDGQYAPVPVWGGVRYVDLYPGVDLELTSEGGHWVQRLRTDFGADLSQVKLRIQGARMSTLEGDHLRLGTVAGEVSLPLFSFTGSETDAGNIRQLRRIDDQTFDLTHPFTSDEHSVLDTRRSADPPRLLYSTFLGGTAWAYGDEAGDRASNIAIDNNGAAYVTGATKSLNFPTTPGAFDEFVRIGGRFEAFVVKIDPGGDALAYATFIGGREGDSGSAIVVDVDGAAYFTGWTYSSDFPTTSNALDRTLDGDDPELHGGDAFISKLSPDGTALEYSTFLGGNGRERAYGIAVDQGGAAYVTGDTASSDFPTTPGAFDTTHNGGLNYYGYSEEGFVAKLAPDGSSLIYASYLGGEECCEPGYAIAVDGAGAAHVAGVTKSADFPTTPGAFDRELDGSWDAYVVKLTPDGSDSVYSTFLGGSQTEYGADIALDQAGTAYVTGRTTSPDFPTMENAFDSSLGGSFDAFVVRLNSDGSAVTGGTFLGGDDGFQVEEARAIALDDQGAAYVTGITASSDFPTTAEESDTTHNGDFDIFVSVLDPTLSILRYSTFLGGSESDSAHSIALDSAAAAYVVGATWSDDFPATPGAFDTTYDGGYFDAFVTKLAIHGTPTYSLSGRVLDTTVAPLTGVTVRAGTRAVTVTDSSGNYEFANLRPGTYTIQAERQHWAFNPSTRTVVLDSDLTGQDFVGVDVSAVISEVHDLAADTSICLSELLNTSQDIAEDGDYFAVAKKAHQAELVAAAILGAAGSLTEGVESVAAAKDVVKVSFPGVVGRGWGHILSVRDMYKPAQALFSEAIRNPISPVNASRAAESYLEGALAYYTADALDAAIEDRLLDTAVKHNWQTFLLSDLGLQDELYPSNERLVTLYVHDLGTTTYQTADHIPFMLPNDQEVYIEDLRMRSQANSFLASALERRAASLQLARAAQEAEDDTWLQAFLAKHLLKNLLPFLFDGTAPVVVAIRVGVEAGAWMIDLSQKGQRVDDDWQMKQLAVSGMSGALMSETRAYLNAVHGMDNIAQRIEPQIPDVDTHADVLDMTDIEEGEYKLFRIPWWCVRSAYSEVDLRNPTSYRTTYEATANYWGRLARISQPLIAQGAATVGEKDSETLRIYYKRDDQGARPQKDTAINVQLLGSTDTGTYYITSFGGNWDPARQTPSAVVTVGPQDRHDVPAIPYPIRTRMMTNEDQLTYTRRVWVDNPFTETVVVTLTQPLINDIQVVDTAGGIASENALRWQRTVSPQTSVEITHAVRYLGRAGQTVDYLEPQLEMESLDATAHVTFTGQMDTFISQPPLRAVGTPPAQITQGESAAVPITVTNRLNAEPASGSVHLKLMDFVAEKELYTATEDVWIPPNGHSTVDLVLNTTGVRAGDYLIVTDITSNGGGEEIFAEYIMVKPHTVYLPLALRD